MKDKQTVRIETDALGSVEVPIDALYGVQTIRALDNFQITKRQAHPELFLALAHVKKACALANHAIGDMDTDVSEAIVQSCDEILNGQHKAYFVTDMIQGGAGTSLNMNVNEVIANRASQLLGGTLGTYHLVHPNDHVNRAQSTNDVIPTAGKLTTLTLGRHLLNEVSLFIESLDRKVLEFDDVIKVGRTHLQDAVLISMGQVFGSYATLMRREARRLENALQEMLTTNMGATAVGTGINSFVGYQEKVVSYLSESTGFKLVSAQDLVDGTKHIDGFAYVHSSLKTMALGLSRMCNDLRLMASGPKAGFQELRLPERQPGSSIMPGKVNPVIPEVVNQICFQVIGNDTTITMACEAGQMELNVFEPVVFKNLFESLELLKEGLYTLRTKCIDDIEVNQASITSQVESSLAIATGLVNALGYKTVSDLTKQSLKENKTLKACVLEHGLLDEATVDMLLDPSTMIQPKVKKDA